MWKFHYIIVLISVRDCFDRTQNVTYRVWINYFRNHVITYTNLYIGTKNNCLYNKRKSKLTLPVPFKKANASNKFVLTTQSTFPPPSQSTRMRRLLEWWDQQNGNQSQTQGHFGYLSAEWSPNDNHHLGKCVMWELSSICPILCI